MTRLPGQIIRTSDRTWAGFLAAGLCTLAGPSVAAQGDAGAETSGEQSAEPEPMAETSSEYETTITGEKLLSPDLPSYRARSEITREELERRLPRSAPDALRFEPGVFVQQTAHSQGSAFVRGLTGQQTLLMFDGIRLNNSTFRQGPNQYFFTLDSQTIHAIQILRGGASTRYGSDALGGVILALPIEPVLRPDDAEEAITQEPHLRLRTATADNEIGGRGQIHLTAGDSLAFFGGAGGRTVGQLQSGGILHNTADQERPPVPRFAGDNRTQLGTGFNELIADGRLLFRPAPGHVLKLAAYLYRQFDAPRTDQCPAAFAPWDECLTYDEQFRTLVYGVWEGAPGFALLRSLRATLSWQQQHERRTLRRPSSYVENAGRDTINTLGATFTAKSSGWQVLPWLRLSARYGIDTYHDLVQSAAWISFSDIEVTARRSRGQYLDGSGYTYGGLFAEGTARLFADLRLRAGGRLSWIYATAPADPDSDSRAVNRAWLPVVGNAGLEWRATDWLELLVHVDRSYRPPNLDDMTSRQQTGPGFQFENPDLRPEAATTFEVGSRVTGPVRAEVWGFATLLDGAVIKSPRQDTECPANTPRCRASWTRFQLINAREVSYVAGIEASIFAALPSGLESRATVAWTWGEGPNPGDPPSDPTVSYAHRVPLSRIPPLNGTVELLWRHTSGLSAGAAVRWAAHQDRLALADISDARIPAGGTPGFAVLDLRASYRLEDMLLVSVAMENILDAAYRYHGSSVNGPGRGLVVLLDLGPVWRL